jgi:hypothetical protein
LEAKFATSVTQKKVSNTFFQLHLEESIQHLFSIAITLNFIHLVFGLAPPKNVDDLFNLRLKQGGHKPKLRQAYRLCVGLFGSLEMMMFLTNVNQKLLCRFYSGNVLATPLGAVAA